MDTSNARLDEAPVEVEHEVDVADLENADLDDAETPPQEDPETRVSGFWRRFLAFTIDLVLMATPLLILGFVFPDFTFSLGPYGRLIGLAIIIPYWGYFNSEKRKGQTIGKQLTKIAVTERYNGYLPLGRSFLRALILGAILFLNGWALPALQLPVMSTLVLIIVVGGGLATAYGLVFNRTTRQGLHDLGAGSFVINAPPSEAAMLPPLPRAHQRITYGLLGVGLLAGIAGLIWQQNPPLLGFMEEGQWQEVQDLQSSLMGSGDFFSIDVMLMNSSRIGGESVVIRSLNVEAWTGQSCQSDPDRCDEMVREIARTALAELDTIDRLDGMRIVVSNRFDLGLANGSFFRSGAFTIEDWRDELSAP